MKWWASFALLCVLFVQGHSQVNGSYPLVQFTPPSAVIGNTTLKVFSTSMLININLPNINESSFTESAIAFYSSVGIGGFQNVSSISFPGNPTNYTVSYDINYIYNEMNTTDEFISQTINNQTYVESGLQNTSLLQASSVQILTFSFTGNPLCSVATCPVYSSICNENENGVTIQCMSNCLLGYCSNGWCIHDNPNSKPTCSCPTGGSDWWYVDDRCHTVLYLWMIIVYFLLVFLAIITIIIIGCICTKRMLKRPIKEKTPKVETTKIKETGLAKSNGNTELKLVASTKSNNYHETPVITNQVPEERQELPLPTNQRRDSFSTSSSSEEEEEKEEEEVAGEDNKTFVKDKEEERRELPKVSYYSQVPPVGQTAPPRYISEACSTTEMSSADSSEEDDGISNQHISQAYSTVNRSQKKNNYDMFPHITTV